MQQISSVNNATIKKLAKLKQKKYRDDEGLYLIEGFHLFEEALKAGKKYQYILGTEEALDHGCLDLIGISRFRRWLR